MLGAPHWQEGPWKALIKPRGLPVFPPHGDPMGDCVLARLEPAWRELSWPLGFEGGIAHRLDTNTSGILLVADDPLALESLRRLFRDHRLTKRYVFLTRYQPKQREVRMERAIGHHPRRSDRMIVEAPGRTCRGRWLPARSHFRVLGKLPGQEMWAVQAEIWTGVMHQIRVHAAAAGFALAGDRIYSGGPLGLPPLPEDQFLLHHWEIEGPGLKVPRLEPAQDWPRGWQSGQGAEGAGLR
jgi:23S rRNA-/tRNA-specific pseudouridylate synthase